MMPEAINNTKLLGGVADANSAMEQRFNGPK
jgi:hypothetical protein